MKSSRFESMRSLPLAVVVVVMTMCLLACADKEQELMKGNFDPEKFATMTTNDVSTLISDSGVVRYKIESPIWLVFDQAARPYWNFPKGLHLEKYNDLFRVEAEVRCDSARYFKNDQLWRLDGYVEVTNMAGEKFLTPQLYWDQRHQKLYSDSFIHIERQGRIIEGYGFTSNERMTQYEVKKVMGMFPASDFRAGANEKDSTAAASTATGNTQGKTKVYRPDIVVTDSVNYANPGHAHRVVPSNRDDSRPPITPGPVNPRKPLNPSKPSNPFLPR